MSGRILNADQARAALDAQPCPTCGATRFVREAELVPEGLRYQTCASCGAARDVVLALPEAIEAGLAGVGVHEVAAIEALAGWVASAFPAFASPKEQLHGGRRTDPSGVEPGRGWTLVAWLRGSTGYGQGRYRHTDGTRALVTATGPQRLPAAELVARLRMSTPGIAPLLALVESGDHVLMRETEPPGVPLSTPMFPLAPEAALTVFAGVLAILERAAAAGEVLNGLRPELVYVTDGAVVTGLAPRCEAFASTMVESLDLSPTYPFAALYAPAEVLNAGTPSTSADVFSACAVFLYALTRRPPFAPDGTVIEQMMAMMKGPPAIPASVPGPIAELVRAGLAAAPELRPTARELLAALREHGYAGRTMLNSERAVTFDEVDDGMVRYQATVDGKRWQVRINALPASRYTLLIDGAIVEEHATWPAAWIRTDDPYERTEYERELDHLERTRAIQPSKLVT